MTSEVVLIGSDMLGAPDPQLGGVLMGNFLRLMGDRDELPSYIILWNGGVRLAAVDSAHLDHLKRLQQRGVSIILCRTCVEYFGLDDKVDAGEIDGMVRIQDILFSHKVLTV